ncbi:MAG TPA: hypothetical protein PKE51_06905 [Gemmatimonadaceae bacterium]|nr:hypothetical protein [Gemmatimonadaceae bacterium]
MRTATSTAPNTNATLKDVVDTAKDAVQGAVEAVEQKVKAATSSGRDRKKSVAPLRLDALRNVPTDGSLAFVDVRGWKVHMADGSMIGTVSRILVEQTARELMPRYLDVHLSTEATKASGTRTSNLLIPIGRVRLDRSRELVQVPALTADVLKSMPRLADGAITWEFELDVARTFGIDNSIADQGALYRTDLFAIDHVLVIGASTR